MDFIKLAQRSDAVLGLIFLALALYWLTTGSYLWGGVAILSSAASFASAKYVPARWLVKRMMLARLK
ncbi:hypothetical protein WJ96_05135 [Burkholderia ubonensis]|uniref:DUF2892 domain-containing protein n=1 Tax=Burkholderia ubonensis TaxID=101571 RepID=A0AAW3MXM9_9BURK|nr:hypothetical protein [Burkholderia ubonensis]KVP75148.1 hypothetical protein WJ93_06955 [Burkholderia ubonensis]KVP96611.1 hypothetical protein WJ97_12055 [Burkholderia ubonensis]KVP97956.1 hypothetical protein WJ96_05135 [Burkholderia ubonensis]KVZ92653.1 hypothetical protein WL25_16790 [Burkholderia ubonensis]